MILKLLTILESINHTAKQGRFTKSILLFCEKPLGQRTSGF